MEEHIALKLILIFAAFLNRASARQVVHSEEDIFKGTSGNERKLSRTLPEADGNLNLYVLPAGQGDAQVIQCPNGDLSIIDLGRGYETWDPKYWQPQDIRLFLSGKFDLVRNLLVTHNHWDHYILFVDTFTAANELPNVENMYITCGVEHMPSLLLDWVLANGLDGRARTFNGGNACGPNGIECGNLDICPGDSRITAKVLAANLGGNCATGNKNMDSILFKLSWGSVSVLMTGDFEDETTDWNEDGPQKKVVDYYGSEMEVTVYKISHHGASRLANKPVFRDAVRPKAIFATGNPWYLGDYRHPRCAVSDAFIQYVGTLCKPGVSNSSDPAYCGDPIDPSWTLFERLQDTYSCGESSGGVRTYNGNEYAIYSTTPNVDSVNFLAFKTDGTRWGIKNDIYYATK